MTSLRHSNPRFAVVSSGVLIIGVTYGLARYGFGLFVPELRDSFELSTSAIGLLASGAYATYLIATALIAWATARVGLRRPVLAAGALAAGGMLLIALAEGTVVLAAGVLIAGASSGVAYPPFAEAVKRLLPEVQQPTAVAVINSGTSYGVLISGPLALAAGDEWRLAWMLFAALAVGATVWSAIFLPRTREETRAPERPRLRRPPTALVSRRTAALFVAALGIGCGTSVYWTFAVDLVVRDGSLPSNAGRMLVVLIGIAGIAGGLTGEAVRRVGASATFVASTGALAASLLLLAASPSALALVAVSGTLFGATYFASTACLGMWSLRLFSDRPAVGFGATYFLISVGQLVGPLPAGLLAESFGLKSAFYVGAALTLATLLFAWRGEPDGERAPSAPANRDGFRPRQARRDLATTGHTLADRGLLPGTAGNLSVLLSRHPLRVAVTPSGVDKGALRPGQILIVDEHGSPVDGHGRPAYEFPLHLSIFKRDAGARAVCHTHSVWSVLASQRDPKATVLRLADCEQLKGLEGVTSHEHEELVPILDNDQDMRRMSAALADAIEPATHAVLLRGHGLYTWGSSLAAARRHIETFEFLLEADVRRRATESKYEEVEHGDSTTAGRRPDHHRPARDPRPAG